MKQLLQSAVEWDRKEQSSNRGQQPTFLALNRGENLITEAREFVHALCQRLRLKQIITFVPRRQAWVDAMKHFEIPRERSILVFEGGEQLGLEVQEALLRETAERLRFIVFVTQCASETLRLRGTWSHLAAQRIGRAFEWPAWDKRGEDQHSIIQQLVKVFASDIDIAPPKISENVYDVFASGHFAGTERIAAMLGQGLVVLRQRKETTLTAEHLIGDALRRAAGTRRAAPLSLVSSD